MISSLVHPLAIHFHLLTACRKIQLSIISDAPEMQGQLVSAHGMLAILEVLEGRGSREVIMRLLQIINLVRLVNDLPRLYADRPMFGSWSRPMQAFWRGSV